MFTSYQLRQDWNQDLPKYWLDNSPFKTHFMNSMSAVFPNGERFFIDAVKNYKDTITDLKLLAEVNEFVKQEVWHGHAHQKYNDWLAQQGLPVAQAAQANFDRLEKVKNKYGPKGQLAVTVGLEHITAITSSVSLRNRTFYRSMHPHFEQIWFWHAVEEVEHKAVTMDVWCSINGKEKSLHRALFVATILYWYTILSTTVKFLHADKQLWRWRNIKDAWEILFAKNTGMIRAGYNLWKDFFKQGFHPTDHDDTVLLKYRKG